MSLSDEQWEFLKDVSRLISYADELGYKLTSGELYRTPEQAEINANKGVGIRDSLHTKRLAVDFNLFIDGNYRTDSQAHEKLGEFWEALNDKNRWGGRFSRPDGNHYERNA